MFLVPFSACISKPEKQLFICMLEDGEHTHILHFLHTTTNHCDNHAQWEWLWLCGCGHLSESLVASFSVFTVRGKVALQYEQMCKNVREEEEIANVSHVSHKCFFFLKIFLVFVRPIFSWCMHQKSGTLPEGKLPHTTSSFNTGPKEIILSLLQHLSHNYPLHLFHSF